MNEQEYMYAIKNMPCGVCGQSAPSDAHHILENSRRISHYATIPLCKSCHQDNHNGIHGSKAMWKVMRKTELGVLSETIKSMIISCEKGYL
jgi:uncharacterized Fe-S center protein